MSASLIKIPHDIKQQYLPFYIKNGSPLKFSFRSTDAAGKLGICPNAFTKYQLNDDISFSAVLDPINHTPGKVTINTLFNSLPGIQIREFLPDTKLELCINAFADILGTVTDLFTKDKDKMQSLTDKAPEAKPEGSLKSFFTLLTEAMNWTLQYLTGSGSENIYNAIKGEIAGKGSGKYSSPNKDTDIYVLDFPYVLYYCFLSCTTTNLYELPCTIDGNAMYYSEGKGWDGDNTIALTNNFLGNIPVLGSLMKSILGNVRINYLPFWDSSSGQGTAEPEVTVKFDLFNDSAEAAMMNFIFVNTLVPSNKWIQYNMFLHSSNLYDIKIEGYNRLYACTGTFSVSSAGVMRDPHPDWVLQLLAYKNERLNLTKDDIIKHKLIKIPDVYKVEMKFSSLLPANFNNYIYTWACNNNILEEYNGKPRQDSLALKAINEGIKDFASKIKSHWDAEDFKVDVANFGDELNNKIATKEAQRTQAAERKAKQDEIKRLEAQQKQAKEDEELDRKLNDMKK